MREIEIKKGKINTDLLLSFGFTKYKDGFIYSYDIMNGQMKLCFFVLNNKLYSEITDEFGELTAEQFDPDCYYYSVTTGKDGILKVISNPVMIYDEIIAQVDSLSAKITSDLQFQVEVGIPSSSEFAGQVADKLQLLIKTGAADEIYVVDCEYKGGVATMSFDCTNLIFDGLWYDVVLVWDGAVVMDIPKNFEGKAVDTNSNVKKDGIVYSIVSWKPDNAPAGSEMIKICFEEDSTRYADEILKSYIVTFDAETASLMVTAKIKGDVAPVLAITSGDKTILASADGVKNADGSYSYTLAVEDAFTRAERILQANCLYMMCIFDKIIILFVG